MFIYGKSAANGIAVMSYLAVVAPRRAGSAEIANGRHISRVLTAKLLTQLSSAGLVTGQPGPGGGYTLAKSAEEIRLLDIVGLFGHLEESAPCPFGSGWCGNQDPCPLHDSIADLMAKHRCFLEDTSLFVFQQDPRILPPGMQIPDAAKTRRSATKHKPTSPRH